MTSTAPETAPLSPKQQALNRLARSRARLRAAVIHPVEPHGPAPVGLAGRRLRAAWRHWRRRLLSLPQGAVLVPMLEAWWARQPVATWARQGLEETRTVVLPWVRRHPGLALGAAAAAGAGVVVGRHWLGRWLKRRTRTWPGRAAAWLWGQAQDPVTLLWLGGWVQQWLAKRRPAPAPAPAPATPSPAEPAEAEGPSTTNA